MNTNLQKLIEILRELKIASINSSPDTIHSTMRKYNMLFLGAKFNTIYSSELYLNSKTIFNFDISSDELHSLLPSACNALNIKFESLTELKDMGKSEPSISYQVVLWE